MLDILSDIMLDILSDIMLDILSDIMLDILSDIMLTDNSFIIIIRLFANIIHREPDGDEVEFSADVGWRVIGRTKDVVSRASGGGGGLEGKCPAEKKEKTNDMNLNKSLEDSPKLSLDGKFYHLMRSFTT